MANNVTQLILEKSATVSDQAPNNELIIGTKVLADSENKGVVEPAHSDQHYWNKATQYFGMFSEACNSGIVINIIDMFEHSVMLIAYGALAFFAHYADAFIYVFKACIRATKSIGRTFFNIQFEDDVENWCDTELLLAPSEDDKKAVEEQSKILFIKNGENFSIGYWSSENCYVEEELNGEMNALLQKYDTQKRIDQIVDLEKLDEYLKSKQITTLKKQNSLQTLLDLLALLFFSATIVLLITASLPIAITIGWVTAFIGMVIVGYSDYYLPTLSATTKLDQELRTLLKLIGEAQNNESPEIKEQYKVVEKLYQDYLKKNKSCNLYGLLVAGLAVLLICSSAMGFAAGLALIVLGVLAKIASAYLAGIAVFRCHNYFKSKSETEETRTADRFFQTRGNKPADEHILEWFPR